MRGFWFIVEAVFASLIIVGFLLFIGRVYIAAPAPENMYEKTYEILKGMDEQGILRNYTVNEDYDAINAEVGLYTYNHSVEICDYEGTCKGSRPNASNIWAGTYMIAGNGSYKPYTVRLYLWQGAG